MTLRIGPLGAALGAEITGLDLARPLEPEEAGTVRDAFLEHHLLCFRSVPLTAEDFLRVACLFGEPQLQLLRSRRDGSAPEVSVLDSTYRRPEDKPADLTKVRLSGWHTDDSYFEIPAKATMLQALALPTSGGETLFCNTRAAFEALPEDRRTELDGRRAVHSYDTPRAPGRAVKRTAEEAAETPDVIHPLVRTHEETGKKAIYFNPNRTDRVLDMDRGESDRLLDVLYGHMTQSRFRYDHAWRVGDILLWDNRCLVHAVNTDFPVGEERRHQRVLLKGRRPR